MRSRLTKPQDCTSIVNGRIIHQKRIRGSLLSVLKHIIIHLVSEQWFHFCVFVIYDLTTFLNYTADKCNELLTLRKKDQIEVTRVVDQTLFLFEVSWNNPNTFNAFSKDIYSHEPIHVLSSRLRKFFYSNAFPLSPSMMIFKSLLSSRVKCSWTSPRRAKGRNISCKYSLNSYLTYLFTLTFKCKAKLYIEKKEANEVKSKASADILILHLPYIN